MAGSASHMLETAIRCAAAEDYLAVGHGASQLMPTGNNHFPEMIVTHNL
jgi:hypothetical protein